MIKPHHPVIRIIAAILIATSIVSDIAWAHPDGIAPRQENTNLAPTSIFRDSLSVDKVYARVIEEYIEDHSGIDRSQLRLDVVASTLLSHKGEKWYDDHIAYRASAGEVVITFAGTGYALRYYDPQVAGESDGAGAVIASVALNDRLAKELIRVAALSAPAVPAEPAGGVYVGMNFFMPKRWIGPNGELNWQEIRNDAASLTRPFLMFVVWIRHLLGLVFAPAGTAIGGTVAPGVLPAPARVAIDIEPYFGALEAGNGAIAGLTPLELLASMPRLDRKIAWDGERRSGERNLAALIHIARTLVREPGELTTLRDEIEREAALAGETFTGRQDDFAALVDTFSSVKIVMVRTRDWLSRLPAPALYTISGGEAVTYAVDPERRTIYISRPFFDALWHEVPAELRSLPGGAYHDESGRMRFFKSERADWPALRSILAYLFAAAAAYRQAAAEDSLDPSAVAQIVSGPVVDLDARPVAGAFRLERDTETIIERRLRQHLAASRLETIDNLLRAGDLTGEDRDLLGRMLYASLSVRAFDRELLEFVSGTLHKGIAFVELLRRVRDGDAGGGARSDLIALASGAWKYFTDIIHRDIATAGTNSIFLARAYADFPSEEVFIELLPALYRCDGPRLWDFLALLAEQDIVLKKRFITELDRAAEGAHLYDVVADAACAIRERLREESQVRMATVLAYNSPNAYAISEHYLHYPDRETLEQILATGAAGSDGAMTGVVLFALEHCDKALNGAVFAEVREIARRNDGSAVSRGALWAARALTEARVFGHLARIEQGLGDRSDETALSIFADLMADIIDRLGRPDVGFTAFRHFYERLTWQRSDVPGLRPFVGKVYFHYARFLLNLAERDGEFRMLAKVINLLAVHRGIDPDNAAAAVINDRANELAALISRLDDLRRRVGSDPALVPHYAAALRAIADYYLYRSDHPEIAEGYLAELRAIGADDEADRVLERVFGAAIEPGEDPLWGAADAGEETPPDDRDGPAPADGAEGPLHDPDDDDAGQNGDRRSRGHGIYVLAYPVARMALDPDTALAIDGLIATIFLAIGVYYVVYRYVAPIIMRAIFGLTDDGTEKTMELIAPYHKIDVRANADYALRLARVIGVFEATLAGEEGGCAEFAGRYAPLAGELRSLVGRLRKSRVILVDATDWISGAPIMTLYPEERGNRLFSVVSYEKQTIYFPRLLFERLMAAAEAELEPSFAGERRSLAAFWGHLLMNTDALRTGDYRRSRRIARVVAGPSKRYQRQGLSMLEERINDLYVAYAGELATARMAALNERVCGASPDNDLIGNILTVSGNSPLFTRTLIDLLTRSGLTGRYTAMLEALATSGDTRLTALLADAVRQYEAAFTKAGIDSAYRAEREDTRRTFLVWAVYLARWHYRAGDMVGASTYLGYAAKIDEDDPLVVALKEDFSCASGYTAEGEAQLPDAASPVSAPDAPAVPAKVEEPLTMLRAVTGALYYPASGVDIATIAGLVRAFPLINDFVFVDPAYATEPLGASLFRFSGLRVIDRRETSAAGVRKSTFTVSYRGGRAVALHFYGSTAQTTRPAEFEGTGAAVVVVKNPGFAMDEDLVWRGQIIGDQLKEGGYLLTRATMFPAVYAEPSDLGLSRVRVRAAGLGEFFEEQRLFGGFCIFRKTAGCSPAAIAKHLAAVERSPSLDAFLWRVKRFLRRLIGARDVAPAAAPMPETKAAPTPPSTDASTTPADMAVAPAAAPADLPSAERGIETGFPGSLVWPERPQTDGTDPISDLYAWTVYFDRVAEVTRGIDRGHKIWRFKDRKGTRDVRRVDFGYWMFHDLAGSLQYLMAEAEMISSGYIPLTDEIRHKMIGAYNELELGFMLSQGIARRGFDDFIDGEDVDEGSEEPPHANDDLIKYFAHRVFTGPGGDERRVKVTIAVQLLEDALNGIRDAVHAIAAQGNIPFASGKSLRMVGDMHPLDESDLAAAGRSEDARRVIESLHAVCAEAGIDDSAEILLSESLFDPEDIVALRCVTAGSHIRIESLEEIRRRATNSAACRTQLACVLGRDEFATGWAGSHRQNNRATVLVLDDDLRGERYLYTEGVIGFVRAMMRDDAVVMERYAAILFGTTISDDLFELLKDDNPIAFAIKAVLRFRPILPVDPVHLPQVKQAMEAYLRAA